MISEKSMGPLLPRLGLGSRGQPRCRCVFISEEARSCPGEFPKVFSPRTCSNLAGFQRLLARDDWSSDLISKFARFFPWRLNFSNGSASKLFVSAKASRESGGEYRSLPGTQTEAKPVAKHFSFGARRLFIPPKSLMSPIFEPDAQRPRAILRLRSTYP